MKVFHYRQPFHLELSGSLTGLTIAYHTYGHLNASRSNVIWICHALTANSDPQAWWPGVVGPSCVIDPSRYFIVCANILGSCYGSTGPLSVDPETDRPYYHDFPQITIRDMVYAHQLLFDHLQLNQILILAGGSMGGYQVLEWGISNPAIIKGIFIIAAAATETPWRIAIHTAQRLAIEADDSWKESRNNAGIKGLKAARAIAMLTYRSYEKFMNSQSEEDADKTDGFRVSGYIHHQATKLAARFNAFSYWALSKAMDTHNIARKRAGIETVLKNITQPVLLIAIENDLLCPKSEMDLMARHIPNAEYHSVYSINGHDGFLTEYEAISEILRPWMKELLVP